MPRGAVIRLAATPDALAQAAASEVLDVYSPEPTMQFPGVDALLASLPFDGWPFVHVWFGDERTVAPDHADSNYRMARETLLSLVPVPESQVHRMAGEQEPAAAAADYDADLRALAARQERAAPAFDVLLLGMGADAHTASLFPGSPLFNDRSATPAACAAAVHVPALDTWRLTITPATIREARTVLVLVAGSDKHPALARVLGSAPSLQEAPVTLVHDLAGDVAWFVDRAALFGEPSLSRS